MHGRCLNCGVPYKSAEDKELCSLYWRPYAGTKAGFPHNGWSCPRDILDSTSEGEKEKMIEVILNNPKVILRKP